jgi:predicted AAA+ superfamily ATPase
MTGAIEQVIREHWENGVPETKLRLIEPKLGSPLISDIVGPRRAGKTYLMYVTILEILKNNPIESTIYINFEKRKLLPPRKEHFDDIVRFIHAEGLLERFGKVYLFLDEVQRIEGWEQHVRSIQDEFKGKLKLFISGSSAKLLSGDYSKLLTGRHLTTTVLPLSFREFLSFNGLDPARAALTEKGESVVRRHLEKYLKFGGFPEIVLEKDKEEMLSQLFTDIIVRDITSRLEVRNRAALEEFTSFLSSNISGLLSFGKVSRYFNSRGIDVSVPTLISYFNMMRDAYLFFDITVFSYSLRNRTQQPRKVYCIDTGLARAASSGESEGLGALCENAVAVELLRRGEKFHYWKDTNGSEVDFVVRQGRNVTPIQVCYRLDRFETRERETKALVRCMDEFKVKEGLVVTFDLEAEEKAGNKKILYVPLWKFLLGSG